MKPRNRATRAAAWREVDPLSPQSRARRSAVSGGARLARTCARSPSGAGNRQPPGTLNPPRGPLTQPRPSERLLERDVDAQIEAQRRLEQGGDAGQPGVLREAHQRLPLAVQRLPGQARAAGHRVDANDAPVRRRPDGPDQASLTSDTGYLCVCPLLINVSATSLQATKAAVDAARENVAAAEASLRQARAHELLTNVAARTVDSTRDEVENARALAEQAKVQLGYAQVFAPVSGKVNVRAARQGEVVAAGAAIVTIMDLTQTWIYAPLPETQADAVQVGDSLRVVMPSGATFQAKVINKAAEADFATQRDVSSRKRDIKTIQLKLLIDNPEMRYVPGMTAEVYIPKNKLVKQ